MLIVAISVMALLLLAGGAVWAITDGQPDGNGHPYVGLMRFLDTSDGLRYRCSGTLISPTLFVTAGHCTYGSVEVGIWFDADLSTGEPASRYPLTPTVTGTASTHPLYATGPWFTHDLGVVVLDAPGMVMVNGEYGVLPTLDQLDSLARKRGLQDRTFTAVGYGLQKSFPTAASWKTVNQKIRMVAYPQLIQINQGIVGDFSLLLSNNASTGGTCFGDSGGPNFIGNTNVIAGVTSFGKNGNCAGTGGVYRVDKADDLNWLATFLN
jgi:hypothetical protein